MLKKLSYEKIFIAIGGLVLLGMLGYDIFVSKNNPNIGDTNDIKIEERGPVSDDEDAFEEEFDVSKDSKEDQEAPKRKEIVKKKKKTIEKKQENTEESKEEYKKSEKVGEKRENKSTKKDNEKNKKQNKEKNKEKNKEENSKKSRKDSRKIININTATASELAENLKGIGEKKANLIVQYRCEKGDFADISEIKNVKGIGEKIFEKIREQIVV